MKSQTKFTPHALAKSIRVLAEDIEKKLSRKEKGDTRQDAQILSQIFQADDRMKQLIYSYLHFLDGEGRLNANNIPALTEVLDMEDNIRKHARQDINEEDYLRKLAAHFEALTETRLSAAEKLKKHAELAERYAKLAQAHEKIAKGDKVNNKA